MRRSLIFITALLLVAAAAWILSSPEKETEDAVAGLVADPENGKFLFTAGGCASCHAAKDAPADTRLILTGGQAFASDFGTFYAPNISNDTTAGIGGWSPLDLLNALKHGTSPDGQHYYPVFPYAAYSHLSAQDVVDLRGFLASLPADTTQSRAHDVGFPFNIRRSLAGWKILFKVDEWVLSDPQDAHITRGRFLVEALGHCGECHTDRNAFGGLQTDVWLAGAPNPSGKGRVPNITSGKLDWSVEDIAEYLSSGFTPDFDSAGGHMALVVENMAQLSGEDRLAIAAYLKAVPAVQ